MPYKMEISLGDFRSGLILPEVLLVCPFGSLIFVWGDLPLWGFCVFACALWVSNVVSCTNFVGTMHSSLVHCMSNRSAREMLDLS